MNRRDGLADFTLGFVMMLMGPALTRCMPGFRQRESTGFMNESRVQKMRGGPAKLQHHRQRAQHETDMMAAQRSRD